MFCLGSFSGVCSFVPSGKLHQTGLAGGGGGGPVGAWYAWWGGVPLAAQDAYTDKELHVWGVAFSADSQQFAVATTHGVFVYSQAPDLSDVCKGSSNPTS